MFGCQANTHRHLVSRQATAMVKKVDWEGTPVEAKCQGGGSVGRRWLRAQFSREMSLGAKSSHPT